MDCRGVLPRARGSGPVPAPRRRGQRRDQPRAPAQRRSQRPGKLGRSFHGPAAQAAHPRRHPDARGGGGHRAAAGRVGRSVRRAGARHRLGRDLLRARQGRSARDRLRRPAAPTLHRNARDVGGRHRARLARGRRARESRDAVVAHQRRALPGQLAAHAGLPEPDARVVEIGAQREREGRGVFRPAGRRPSRLRPLHGAAEAPGEAGARGQGALRR